MVSHLEGLPRALRHDGVPVPRFSTRTRTAVQYAYNTSTTRRQNRTLTKKDRWPKFWSRIIITWSIFSFRAWFSARIVEETLLYNQRQKSGSKRKYRQSYDHSRPKFRPSVFLCWSPVLLPSGWDEGLAASWSVTWHLVQPFLSRS